MLQDIEPYQFNNEFTKNEAKSDDYLIVFSDEKILLLNCDEKIKIPKLKQLSESNPDVNKSLIYLFSIDESAFYLTTQTIKETPELFYKSINNMRESMSKLMVFIISTAKHLAQWYENNRYCGKCASPMSRSPKERALFCKACKITKYPNISPAVIVGIIDKDNDKILLTRYSDRPYKKLALVAGYTEIGESLETTVRREVMEEVGLKVKNITYFKSQPWAFSQSVLMGFFAELDGNSRVNLDTEELSEALWFSREEIPMPETTMSLTNEMIETFRNDNIHITSKHDLMHK